MLALVLDQRALVPEAAVWLLCGRGGGGGGGGGGSLQRERFYQPVLMAHALGFGRPDD